MEIPYNAKIETACCALGVKSPYAISRSNEYTSRFVSTYSTVIYLQAILYSECGNIPIIYGVNKLGMMKVFDSTVFIEYDDDNKSDTFEAFYIITDECIYVVREDIQIFTIEELGVDYNEDFTYKDIE